MSDGALEARALARANIALSKYWGKADEKLNLPAVPSVSVTLEPLTTRTLVRFAEGMSEDRFELDGKPGERKETARVSALLDSVRRQARITLHAQVQSSNDFPTASGLASSASGFAALAAAARAAAGLPFDRAAISALARAASVSAARSAFGGYVELPLASGKSPAELSAMQLAPPEHWPLRVVVAVTSEGRKQVGSTSGMLHTARTSPYYASWVEASPRLAAEAREAILGRDLPRLGAAMEQSTLAMHACAMAAAPAIFYFRPATLAVLERVRALRDEQVPVWATADAGPHVKALCHVDDVERVEHALAKTEGVLRTLRCEPGDGVELAS
jgi:diphosphomevalonate decarboxylase